MGIDKYWYRLLRLFKGGIDIKRIMIILSVLILLLILTTFYFKYLNNKPIRLELIEVARLQTDIKLTGGFLATIYNEDNKVSKQFSIVLPAVDYSINNLIYSTGREVKQLTYKKGDKLPFGDNVYKGYPIFKREIHPHTIFIYKIIKIEIEEDMRANNEIVIEGRSSSLSMRICPTHSASRSSDFCTMG